MPGPPDPTADAADVPYGELVGMVVALSEKVQALVRRQAALTYRPWLTTTDPDDAAQILTDLVAWLDRVWVHYGDHPLPACWYRHPAVIEELHACRHAWVGATAPGAAPGLISEWHRTVRPQTQLRIDSRIGACELERHPRPAAPELPLPEHVSAVITPWVDSRSEPAAATGLTSENGADR